MKKSFLYICGIVLLLMISCTTTDHRITMAPLDVEIPVSATAELVHPNGAIFTADDYTVVDHFLLSQEYKAPIAARTTTTLDITETLRELLDQSGGDGIVNLKIYALQYDPGKTYGVGASRIVAGLSGGVGALLFLAGSATGDDFGTFRKMGISFTVPAVIALGVGLGLQFTSESVWMIGLEGDVVRFD